MSSQHSDTALNIQQQVRDRFQHRQPIDWKLAATDPADDAINVTALNRVVDYPHRDMTVTVEAGMNVSALQNLLAEHDQWLPLSAPWADRLTIAEAVLLDLNGSLAAGAGGFRDWLLGITAVDGQGRVFHSGGRVVKNVAGYDVGKLLVGSAGELAFPLEVTLQTRPRPTCMKSVHLQAENVEQATQLWSIIRQQAFNPAVFDLNHKLELTVAAAGSTEVVEQLLNAVAECRKPVLEPAAIADWSPDSAWNDLELSERRTGGQTIVRIGHRPSETVAVVEQLREQGWRVVSNAARGVTYASRQGAEVNDGQWALFADEMSQNEKTLVPLSGPAALFAEAERQRQSRAVWSLLEPLQAEFDPAGLLSRIEL